MGSKNTRLIKNIGNDNNLCYTGVPQKDKVCPYCGEQMTNTQIVYYIVKTKLNPQGQRVTLGKKLPGACGWNCSRKVIDKLNAERTQEEIEKGIEYRRFNNANS